MSPFVLSVLKYALIVLLYFFVAFSSEGSNDHVLVKGGLALFALVGPSMYVGATLPDLVDVRGVVVTGVVTTVALVTVMSVFVLELSLLDALGGTDLNSGALAVLAALAATTFQPTRVLLRVQPEAGGARLEVRDNGSGIREHLLTRIFDPHFSTRTSGSGLGLAISRRLIDGWGGSIVAENVADGGAALTVRLAPPPSG